MAIWVITALAFLGVAAAITAFFQTPPERRYRVALHVSLEEQLKDCPANMQAVIIKGDKKRAFMKYLPLFFIVAVLTGFILWKQGMVTHGCIRLFGINDVLISLLVLCYVFPVGFFIASLCSFRTGIKVIKTGYFPPLDSIVFRDTIAKKGVQSKVRGGILLAFPIFALFMLYYENTLYLQIAEGASIQEVNEKLERICQERATSRSSGAPTTSKVPPPPL